MVPRKRLNRAGMEGLGRPAGDSTCLSLRNLEQGLSETKPGLRSCTPVKLCLSDALYVVGHLNSISCMGGLIVNPFKSLTLYFIIEPFRATTVDCSQDSKMVNFPQPAFKPALFKFMPDLGWTASL